MTVTTMGPPPPRNPNPDGESSIDAQPKASHDESTTSTTVAMGPPPLSPPRNPKYSHLDQPQEAEQQQPKKDSVEDSATATESSRGAQAVKQGTVPYSIPDWSGPPCHHFYIEVLKDGSIISQLNVFEKGAYMFGRADICDFVLEHPTISRFHAVLQFNNSGDAYLYDLGSTHGTFVNKNKVKAKVYVDLHVGDVIRFGCSTRLFIFQGPPELMPAEADLKIIRDAKNREELFDREASLRRARVEASLADGISWGMGEDAVEEAEDDRDEVTWQKYKGQLTEKQEKTRDKIIKRTEKIAHMKREIDAIRAKDIAQGGLTQGQQTQIARNEQRINQLMEELENLEETLNDSIRESIGARSGKMSRWNRKVTAEDDDEFLSDDDEFYDRTKKKHSIKKSSESQSIETADTLLDKRDTIMKEMEEKKDMLSTEKNKISSESAAKTEAGDTLDAYMSGLSSQLVLDRTVQLQNGLSSLQSELDRILYLLKIADPTGEAAKKRDSHLQEPKPSKAKTPSTAMKKPPPKEPKRSCGSGELVNISMHQEGTADLSLESSKKPETEERASDSAEKKTVTYTVTKPQWLGAVEDKEMKETKHEPETSKILEPDEFVDYKDRKKVLGNVDGPQPKLDAGIENAAPGLIIRKRKQAEKLEGIENTAPDRSTSSSEGAELIAHDAVALLLKHSRGYHAEDDEGKYESQESVGENQPGKDQKKLKRVLGPERPSFINNNVDYESWVPPKGQSGDGRTSLNERYGY